MLTRFVCYSTKIIVNIMRAENANERWFGGPTFTNIDLSYCDGEVRVLQSVRTLGSPTVIARTKVIITNSKVGSLRLAQLLSVVEWRHWYPRYFSSIYSTVRIFQNFTLNFLKCFSKFSDIFLKYLSKSSTITLEMFKLFFENFQNNSQKFS